MESFLSKICLKPNEDIKSPTIIIRYSVVVMLAVEDKPNTSPSDVVLVVVPPPSLDELPVLGPPIPPLPDTGVDVATGGKELVGVGCTGVGLQQGVTGFVGKGLLVGNSL